MRNFYKHLWKVLPVLALGLVLSACGSDDDTNNVPTFYEKPVFSLVSITDVRYSSMTLAAGVSDFKNHTSVAEKGFVYAVSQNPNVVTGTKVVVATGTKDAFSTVVAGMEPETTYYVRAYIRSGSTDAYYYSEQKLVVTADNPASAIGSVSIDAVSFYAIDASSSYDESILSVSEKGFVYSSTVAVPTLGTTGVGKVEDTADGSGITATLSSLSGNTLYYVRTYVVNQEGQAFYSPVKTATTLNPIPVFGPMSVTSVGKVSANVSIAILNAGEFGVAESGFVYSSTSSSPTVSDTKIPSVSMSETLSGLTITTRYYVRAYIRDNAGSYFYTASANSFTTLDADPTLVTFTTYAITGAASPYTCTVNGICSSDSSFPITERGAVYSTTNDYTAGTKVQSGNGSGAFSVPFSVAIGDNYYVWTYVTTSKGTVYSDPQTVTAAPVFTLNSLKDPVSAHRANLDVTVVKSGYPAATEIGVVWSESPNPTILIDASNARKLYDYDGTTGDFTVSALPLKAATRHYMKVYMKNADGVVYSTNELDCTTRTSVLGNTIVPGAGASGSPDNGMYCAKLDLQSTWQRGITDIFDDIIPLLSSAGSTQRSYNRFAIWFTLSTPGDETFYLAPAYYNDGSGTYYCFYGLKRTTPNTSAPDIFTVSDPITNTSTYTPNTNASRLVGNATTKAFMDDTILPWFTAGRLMIDYDNSASVPSMLRLYSLDIADGDPAENYFLFPFTQRTTIGPFPNWW